MPGTVEILNWLHDALPTNKPIYTMGLGRDPDNIITAIKMGVDMFDCVAPTRLARNGALYFGEPVFTTTDVSFNSPYNKGRLQIGNSEFANDSQPIMANCDCFTCSKGYSRAYLNHLYKAGELTYHRLASIHNVRFMVRLSQQVRQWILN